MENFVWSVLENVLEDPSAVKTTRLIYDVFFQKIWNQLLSSSLFLFSVYRFISLRRIAICDIATLMTTRKSSHLWITTKTGTSCFCFKNNNNKKPNVVRYAEDDIICLTTACTSIGNTISLLASPISINIPTKTLQYFFSINHHIFLENWW